MKSQNIANNPILWLWEFSKRVVVLLLAVYILHSGFACAVMIYSGDYTALSTLLTESNETFRVCIGGYLLKAGIENAIKISIKKKKKKPVEQAEKEGDMNT